jgi:hypothetical protein
VSSEFIRVTYKEFETVDGVTKIIKRGEYTIPVTPLQTVNERNPDYAAKVRPSEAVLTFIFGERSQANGQRAVARVNEIYGISIMRLPLKPKNAQRI